MIEPCDWVAGVDGGATRTRFRLADREGRTLAEREGGPGLVGAGEDEALADRIADTVRTMASEVPGRLPIYALCVGLAGVAGRSERRELVERRIASQSVARRVAVTADYDVAFLDAFGDEGGILLIAGTGSVAVGRSGEGPLLRVGGWGALIGDEGSGYRLGLGGIRAAVRGAEGRNPQTVLTDHLFEALGASSPHDVFQWSRTAKKGEIAALAPRVIEVADRGDRAASDIVDRAVLGLIQHAEALARIAALGEQPRVALVGGLVEPGGLLRGRVVSALEEGGFHPLSDPVEPVRGAIQMARGLA